MQATQADQGRGNAALALADSYLRQARTTREDVAPDMENGDATVGDGSPEQEMEPVDPTIAIVIGAAESARGCGAPACPRLVVRTARLSISRIRRSQVKSPGGGDPGLFAIMIGLGRGNSPQIPNMSPN
jgi:hypothetical protein